jgi:hypothetical protein
MIVIWTTPLPPAFASVSKVNVLWTAPPVTSRASLLGVVGTPNRNGHWSPWFGGASHNLLRKVSRKRYHQVS